MPFNTLKTKQSWSVINRYILRVVFYASAFFRRRRHYVFGLYVRLSVRSPTYPLSTCTWVRWSILPTVIVLRHDCPSVRLESFPGICRRTHGGNELKFCMVMYLDHLQNWLDYGHGLLIFLLLAPLWLSETGQIWGFQAFPGEHRGNGLKFCMVMYPDHPHSWLVFGVGL